MAEISQEFKTILMNEGNFNPSAELVDLLLSRMDEVKLKPCERLISYDETDSNLYIVKEGIILMVYIEGGNDITVGMGFPGTFICSPQSFYDGKPALMQFESCKKPSTLLRISKHGFDALMKESHELARWMFNIAMGQIYTTELKASVLNGSAEERYRNILKIRPDIVDAIPANRMASYLRITPSWFCKIRKKLLYE